MTDGDAVKFSFNDTAPHDTQLDRYMHRPALSKDTHAERRALLLGTIRATAAIVASHQTPRDPLGDSRQDYTHTSYVTGKQSCLDYVVATADLTHKAPTSEVCHDIPTRSDDSPLLWDTPTDRTPWGYAHHDPTSCASGGHLVAKTHSQPTSPAF